MRRLISVLLALCLLASAMPIWAWAAAPADAEPGPGRVQSAGQGFTRDEVTAKLRELSPQYPEGTSWDASKYYAWKGGIVEGGYGSAAFAFLLSDLVFGELPARRVSPVRYLDAKPGDILVLDGGARYAVIVQKNVFRTSLAEGGVTGLSMNGQPVVTWNRTVSMEEMEAADYLLTRYPEATPTPGATPTPTPSPTPLPSPRPMPTPIHVITEKEAQDKILAMKPKYPEGMTWTNSNFYRWKGGGVTGAYIPLAGGYGCTAFACLMSDAAFGSAFARRVPASFSTIRIGDILRMDHNTHEAIIIDKSGTGVTVAEGNWGGGKIHWGRRLTAAQVNGGDYVLTRYPNQQLFGAWPKDLIGFHEVGKNVGYTVNTQGVARLSGTGPMYVREEPSGEGVVFGYSPFRDYKDWITSGVVDSGVTGLSDVGTFSDLPYLKKVELKTTKLTRLESRTFANCPSLGEIDLPQGLRELGPECFRGCRALKRVSVPASASKIQRDAFRDCPITDVYYSGTQSQWEALVRSMDPQGNEALLNANVHCAWFADVPASSWYAGAVAYVSGAGIMSGTGGGFTPNGKITRGQLVTILYGLEGRPATGGNPFPDASSGYYAKAVAWAAANKLAGGYPDGSFRPQNPVSRQDLTLILYKYARLKGYDTGKTAGLWSYPDGGQVSSYARGSMEWAVGEGILSGSNGQLLPRGTATRAQMAVMMEKFCRNVAGK